MNAHYDLDSPLLELASSSGRDCWTIRNACQGVQVFGATGSGKTSASRILAIKYLLGQFGGLILTAKADDVDLWRSYCEITDRTNDLIIIQPDSKHTFNFLDYEARNGSDELAETDNIVDVLKTVIQAGETQDTGKSDDPFWQNSLDLLIRNTIDLCKLAYNKVSIQTMYDLVLTIPKGDFSQQANEGSNKVFHQAFEAARTNVNAKIEAWVATLSPDEKRHLQDDSVFERELLNAVPDARLLKFVDGFFIDIFIPLSEKTRSIVELSYSSFLVKLLREPFYSLFCRRSSTVTPDDCLEGKIVLINLPVKLYQKAGRDAQMVCKYVFGRAWERRDVTQNGRPVFLWVDESQLFISERDSEFLTTARSSRIATVFLTQNLPNYMAAMGGQRAEHRVKSLLGNFGTKIMYANSDSETTEWFSKLIGDAYFEDTSESVTVAKNFSQTRGKTRKLERIVRPEQFSNLKTGGPSNGFQVEGYLHRQGDSFLNGSNHIKMKFNQNYQPK